MEISIFKSVKDVSNPYHKPLSYFLDRIKNGSPATQNILEYRVNFDENLKKNLPCATFSGTFSYRNKENLIKFSQIAVLDFDKFADNEKAREFKNKIIKSEYVYACFLSPSNKGVKVLFKVIDEPENYEALYRALLSEFADPHIDKSTKDICRVCYESYDPELYVNENAKEWSKYEVEDITEIGKNIISITVPLKSESRILDILQKWFDKKYQMSEGNRNSNIFTFAIALNQFGINQYTAEEYLSKYAQKSFPVSEIKATVKSVYKKFKNEFNTKAFEDVETKTRIKNDISKGKQPKEIFKALQKENNPISNDEENYADIVDSIKNTDDSDVFWYYNDRGRIDIAPHKYNAYLYKNNFCKYYPESNQDTFIFVKKESNLIEQTNKEKIKDFVLNDLKTREGIGFQPYDFMAKNTKLFSNEFLNMIEAVDIEIKRDTKDQCYLYYNNCVVEIGVDYTKQIEYIDIDKCVWKKTIINRDYKESDHHDSKFRSFIWYISGQNKDSYNSFKSAIGYLLHSYKTTADNKAVILNDEVISDTPNGRSGKGLFFTALKHLKKVDSIDGKDFSFEKNFKFQTVSTDCQVLVFDDVKKNFEFERLFSIITEGIEIEYKNQGTIKIPVEKSPKIVITTNYTIKGEGGSFDARKYELELSSFFNKDYTPIDHFKERLFDSWDESEWSKFDNFMIQCVQYYLKNGLQKQHHKNLELRKFITETSNEFYEWVQDDNLPKSQRLYNNNVLSKFIEEYPDLNKLHVKTFKKWIKLYCEFHGLLYSDGNDSNGGGRYFYISSKQEEKTIIDDCPF